MAEDKKDNLEEVEIKAKLEEAKVEARLEEVKAEVELKEAKIEAKLEEAKIEAKVEEAKNATKKCCGDGKCKKYCKKHGMILAIVVLVLLALGSYGFKMYRQNVDVGQAAIKVKMQKFLSENVPSTTKFEIKDIATEGSLYKVTVTFDKQDVPLYVTRDGKKFIDPQGIRDLDAQPVDATKKAAAAPEQKDIPKSDKPVVDLYVMAFCPFGNKAEDTLKPVYDLLKNKVDFNFHYIVSTSGNDVTSLHGPKEVTEDEKEACVLKTYGKDKWMSIATYVNTNCGSDGTCFDAGAKTLGINSATINSCVTSQGVALMQENETASNKANASGSPTMIINGVSSTTVYQYGNSDAYKQQICDAFNTAPAECAKKLDSQTATAQGGSCATN